MENIRIPWNDWKVVRQLGKGSYGTVYEIERTVGSRVEKAAMKVIPIPPSHQIIEDAYSEGYDYESVLTICKSFYDDTLNEYKLMQSLRGHNNIVACEDIASLPMNDSIGWEVYIRMELLTPLLKYQSSSVIDEKEIIKLGKDICQALIVCENNNIVHRDVKPGNIFVDKYGNYKLGDFGVARTLDHSTNATRVGTERFMAPEVINRKPYNKSVDVYSLGLVMYWLLNGRRMPFLKPEKVPTASEQEKAYYRRISGENLWLPQYGSLPLRKAVLKACSFDRDARYQSAEEMLHALNEAEYSLAQMTNHENSRSSSNAFHNISEDETIGNSWNFEDATVGASFGAKSNDFNADKHGRVYEDKTVGPGWDNNERKNNNRTANNTVNGEYHYTYNKSTNANHQKSDANVKHKKTKTTKQQQSPNGSSLISIVKAIVYVTLIFAVWTFVSTSIAFIYFEFFDTETVTFGGIEWIVLTEEGDRSLLLSKDAIATRRYSEDISLPSLDNTQIQSVTWETCTLRSFLNSTWYEDTFSEEEKDKILTTNVENSNNSEYGTVGGNGTQDKVFLLSIDEAEQYFLSDEERVANYNGKVVNWWLRSPGNDCSHAAYVEINGEVDVFGEAAYNGFIGVRPALWVNLNF